jgi:hypothetical protein
MKLEKFDLEKALNGAKVVTRDGKEVKELTKFEGLSLYILVGLIDGEVHSWNEDGWHHNERSGVYDLFLAVEP